LIFFIISINNKKIATLSYEEIKELYWQNEKNTNSQLNYAKAYLKKTKNENKRVQKARGCYLLFIFLLPYHFS